VIAWLGYPGIVILMALESLCLPVPSELVMPFAGYLASHGRFSLALAALAGAIGCNIGSTVLYFLGATGGRRLVEKWGRYVFLGERRLQRVEQAFHRYGEAIVFTARVLPFTPVIVSFPAGVARMRMWKFQTYTFAGSFLWCGTLAFLGYEFGRTWEQQPWVQSAMHFVDIAVLALVAFGIGWLVWQRMKRPAEQA